MGDAVDHLAGLDGGLLLGIDTCGPTGSVALGRFSGESIEIAGEIELEGRSYSATLVAAVRELLGGAGMGLKDVAAIVAVNGPGSFTGVRVGLSAVKGLAEGAGTRTGGIPVTAVSRLEVLAAKAGVGSAALDAHRHEVFLRLGNTGGVMRELLAGAEELAGIEAPDAIAVCDESAGAFLLAVWPGTELVKSTAPTAVDALRLCAGSVAAGRFVDLALLDGHYLRRSDAEVLFGKGGSESAMGSRGA
ncbi:MAG: tRNA (adenosine(37)-N6)-threonylcarbamoyltransferase complex dimerization subunit type 1 TsaB [Terracidiphilus sp.]|jgi:tRNA threonylcarbamoyladenosine biosynthesis protein TsaB